jgi:hypothetical protein
VFARVVDGDGDPAWQLFTIDAYGGPGTLVQSDFRGTSPALTRPWNRVYVLSPRVVWNGWDISRPADSSGGVTPESGNDEFVFSLNASAAGDETLGDAIAKDEYLRCTIAPLDGAIDLRGAELRFSMKRIGYHSPRGFAVGSSIGGFSEGAMHYVSASVSKDDSGEREHVVRLPMTDEFALVVAPVELRIYGFGAQFAGHRASLTAFKLTTDLKRRRPVRR